MTMTRFFSCLGLGLALLLLLLIPADLSRAGPAAIYHHFGPSSFTWPTDSQWIVLSALNDPDDGLTKEYLDFVGNSNYPGFYYHVGVNYIYFRIRVDFDGTVSSSTFNDTVMIMLDRGGDGSLDYGFAWDSKEAGHGLEMMVPNVNGSTWAATRMDDLDNNSAQKVAPPDINTSGDGYIRTVDGINTSDFGNTTFIDIAVSWTYLYSQTLLRKDETWGIQLGSIANANDHNFIDYDVAGNKAPGDARTFPGSISTGPTAAVLAVFSARADSNGVTVTWETESEVGHVGFNLYRAMDVNGPWAGVNPALILSSSPGAPYGHRYAWLDRPPVRGLLWYRLVGVGADGQEMLLGMQSVRNEHGWVWLPLALGDW